MVSMVIWSVKPILGTSKFNLTIYTPSIRFILVSPTKFNVFIGTISAYESFLFHNYRSNNMILLFIGILSALLQGSITGYATVSAESKSSLSSHSIIWYLKSHCSKCLCLSLQIICTFALRDGIHGFFFSFFITYVVYILFYEVSNSDLAEVLF